MWKLLVADLFSPTFDTETGVQHPAGTPIMLAFVNIAENGGVLVGEEGALLKSALTFLSNNLSDRGTVAVALPDWEFNRTKLKGDNLYGHGLHPSRDGSSTYFTVAGAATRVMNVIVACIAHFLGSHVVLMSLYSRRSYLSCSGVGRNRNEQYSFAMALTYPQPPLRPSHFLPFSFSVVCRGWSFS